LKNYRGLDDVDYVVFSGGVAEHLYNRDRTAYGDVGPLLGASMKTRLQVLTRQNILREPYEGIRATVIGAGEYTMQASGNTSYISSPHALPVFGLKVVQVNLNTGASVYAALLQALAKFDLPAFTVGLALSMRLDGQLDYSSIRKVAEGIAEMLNNADNAHCPLYMTMDADVAKSLGAMLKEELKIEREIVAVDGIDVGDLDYIDIGASIGNTEVVPVTVKSLMFPSAQQD
jgi:ethanolamine utilization protein EutA